MKRMLAACLLLAGCGGGGEEANQAVPTQPQTAQPKADGAALATLTGLYEGGRAARPNQLCITEGKGGANRFGLVVWGANDHSCSGSGTASRRGDSLRLTMLGDSSCTLEAPISGATVTLPAALPQGCAYYCGARASFARASFSRAGSTEADAKKATDIAGDPLCD